MIPNSYIQAWSAKAPWPDSRQIEQDLIISRALCDLFNAPALNGKIAFRGGTAINKLLFKQPLRYSEDIDLVQTQAEPIGTTVDAIRDALSWLGKCNREQAGHSMHLVFKFTPEADAQATLKLKVEINTREHGSLFGIKPYPFAVESDWYQGKTEIASFEPEELFGTKLRALLQRRKNRDLFDLHHGLDQLALNPDKLIACFDHYLALEGNPITRAVAEQRMLEKLTRSLTEDIEYSLRLLKSGKRILYLDTLECAGEVPQTAKDLYRQQMRWAYGVIAAFRKHGAGLLRSKNLSFKDKSYISVFCSGYLLSFLLLLLFATGTLSFLTDRPAPIDVIRFLSEMGANILLTSGIIVASLVALSLSKNLRKALQMALASFSVGLMVTYYVNVGIIKVLFNQPMQWFMLSKEGNKI